MTQTMKMVPLDSIVVSKTNPRKTFDSDDIHELSESIKEKGVIQPILLRPIEHDKYELVCGERRYRASKAVAQFKKEAKVIPAIIKLLTDTEALELQITENLQRKDVHPMEEAHAFGVLMKDSTLEEVSSKVGKQKYYVTRRMKLNSLTPNWQKAYYRDRIKHSVAIKLCVLPAKIQNEIWASKVGKKSKVEDIKEEIHISDYELKNKEGDLHDCTFDPDDEKLIRSVGACTSCQFNSAILSMFPEDVNNPRCKNITCFVKKSEKDFKNKLKEASEDPSILMLSDNWGTYNDSELVRELKEEKHKVYYRDDYTIIDYPEKPEVGSDEALISKYEAAVERINKSIKSGKISKGIMVTGRLGLIGRTLYVKLTKKSTSTSSTGNKAISTIQEQIDGINERRIRSEHLDGEKIHAKVKEDLQSEEKYFHNHTKLSKTELIGLALMLLRSYPHKIEELLNKNYKIDKYDYRGDKNHKVLSKLPESEIQQIVNILLRNKVYNELTSNKDNPKESGHALAIRNIAIEYIPEKVAAHDEDQKGIAKRRKERADARVKALKNQL